MDKLGILEEIFRIEDSLSDVKEFWRHECPTEEDPLDINWREISECLRKINKSLVTGKDINQL